MNWTFRLARVCFVDGDIMFHTILDAHLYVPDSVARWKCLDGSEMIPFIAINDDYCDCADGSDEPGMQAYTSLVDIILQLLLQYL
jgi:hypothetical protein